MHLSDVADVIDDAENVKQAAWMNDVPAVIVNIQRQPGANVIEVVDRIKKLLPQLQGALPAAVQVSVLTDRTTTIRASVRDVQFTLLLSVALVVMVIFLFLRNFAATAIPSVSVPLSLVGTFGVMYLLGFSLDNLSLMALTIATGFVVDDAIVMIENIARYVEAGETPLQAALKGARQIGFTILSLTVSLIAVLIPLLFMGDVVGRLFREFAVTLSVTILISAAVSLTLTPTMCARLLKHIARVRAKRLLSAHGAGDRSDDRLLRADAALGTGAPACDVDRGGRHARHHRAALRRDTEGLFPGAGYRRHPGHLGSAAVHLLCGHGEAPAAAGRSGSAGSGRREPVFVHRHRRHQQHAQQRAHPGQLEAARAAGGSAAEIIRRLQPKLAEVRRHHALHAAGAGPFDRGPREPHAVPVHAGGRGCQ